MLIWDIKKGIADLMRHHSQLKGEDTHHRNEWKDRRTNIVEIVRLLDSWYNYRCFERTGHTKPGERSGSTLNIIPHSRLSTRIMVVSLAEVDTLCVFREIVLRRSLIWNLDRDVSHIKR